MFVETMTFKEMRREFEKEKYVVLEKTAALRKKVAKLMRQTNMSRYDKVFDYHSPLKNHWKFHVRSTTFGGKLVIVTMYCLFYTEKSYAVITYSRNLDLLTYISSHFFVRYFQREGLEKENLHEIIVSYFVNNPEIANERLEAVAPGVWQIFAQSAHGVALGFLHLESKLTELRTFITNNMLKGDQITLSKQIEEKFKIHIVRSSPGRGNK